MFTKENIQKMFADNKGKKYTIYEDSYFINRFN